MKQKISIILVLVLMLSLGHVSFANSDITVKLDGETLNFDVQPQLIDGRTMVPLRVIFESLGAVVEWDSDTSTVTAYNELYIVKATIGNNTMLVNGQEKQIDVPPMIVNSRTLVPVRFVAEAFNCDVQWDGNTKTVYITSENNDYSQVEQPQEPDTNSDISVEYYDGTHIPTYTSVTGYNGTCGEVWYYTYNDYVMPYIYEYNESALDNYIDTLNEKGWKTVFSEPSSLGNYRFILTNDAYKEQVRIFVSVAFGSGSIYIIPVTNNILEYYPGTNIPTYTSITGVKLLETFDAEDNTTVYSYAKVENSLQSYLSIIMHNGWEVEFVESDDINNRFIVFKGQTKNNESFAMSVDSALEEIWIYIEN